MSHFNSQELKNGLCKSIVIANSVVAKTKLPFVEEVVVDGIVVCVAPGASRITSTRRHILSVT